MTIAAKRAASALLGAFLLLSIYAWLAGRPDHLPGPLDKPRFIAQEEERVRASLSDPESARFRSEVIGGRDGKHFLCGEVNARNTLGGYAGYERFVSGEGRAERAGALGAEHVDALWAERCPARAAEAAPASAVAPPSVGDGKPAFAPSTSR
jgi:hypothetical protein